MDIRNFLGGKPGSGRTGSNSDNNPNSSAAAQIFDLTGSGEETDVPKEEVRAAIAQKSKASQAGEHVSPQKAKQHKGPVLKQTGVGEGGPYAKEAVAAVNEAVKLLPENAEDLKMTILSEASYIGRAPDEPKLRGIKDKAPIGHPDALSGKSFVITGVLDSMLRPEMEEYLRTHGGRVLSSVSGKTSFLIVGEHSGKSKVTTAKSKGVKLIDEDGLLSLVIASIPAKQSAEGSKKESIDQPHGKEKVIGSVTPMESQSRDKSDASELLWVDKWKPKSSSELVGNNTLVSNLKTWLSEWEDVHLHGKQANSTRRGKVMEHKKCVLLSGSPGIGKTSAALIIAKECGYEPIEVNASDTRSKSDSSILKGIGGKLSNIVREMSTNSSLNLQGRSKGKKLCLIMDEVDGMSAGDRGGVADLIKTIAKSKVPIIAVCNDKYSMKLKSLRNHCMELDFRKPTVQQIQKRISLICQKEGLHMNEATMHAVIQNANGGDIRAILGRLQMIRRRTDHLSYTDLSNDASKDVEMSPFEAARRLLDMDASSSLSFSDQIELVFQDADLVPLLVQENYLNHRPKIAASELSVMAVLAKAAEEFSGGDLVSRSVRQYQNWSLMPFACALGTVNPASYARGPRQIFGLYPNEANFPRFTSWLGQNSSHSKNKRLLGEIHTNMISSANFCANRTSLRLEYWSPLRKAIVQPLGMSGKEGIPITLALMNDYDIHREHVDSLLEIGKFKTKSPWGRDMYKEVATAVKTAFTRAFNQQKVKSKTGNVVKNLKSKKRAVEEAFGDEGVNDAGEEEEAEALQPGDVQEKFSKIQNKNVAVSLSINEKKKPGKKGSSKTNKKPRKG